jgi:DNA-binding beta-propeller fold protein YncE
VPELSDELRQLAEEAARQAHPLPVTEVIRQGDRRQRRAIARPRGRAGMPGLATPATPGRRWPGWAAPLAAACAVTLAVGLAVALGGHVRRGGHPERVNDGPAETAYVFSPYQGTVTPISPVTGKLGKPVTVGPRGYWTGRVRRRFQNARIAQDLILPDGTTNYALYWSGRGLDANRVLRRTSLVTGVAGRPIQLGRHVQSVLITPDGRTAYVIYNGQAESTIRPVSLATGTVGKPILRALRNSTPWITPVMTPDGRTIYVPYLRAGTVTPISTATNTVGKPIPVPKALTMEFTSNGRTAFVYGGGTVTPISTATNTPGRAISLGPHPDSWAYTPDGRTVYVSDLGFSVTPISIGTGKAGKSIPLYMEGGVSSMAITPDGRTLYVASFNDNKVLPISVATNTAGKPLTVTGENLDIVLTPDGRTAYVFSGPVNNSQVVTPISTAANTLGKPIRTAPDSEVLVPGGQVTQY